MLTMVLLMRALDPLLHEQETDLYLEKLVQVDACRQGYYRDLSKCTLLDIRKGFVGLKLPKLYTQIPQTNAVPLSSVVIKFFFIKFSHLCLFLTVNWPGGWVEGFV